MLSSFLNCAPKCFSHLNTLLYDLGHLFQITPKKKKAYSKKLNLSVLWFHFYKNKLFVKWELYQSKIHV